MRIDPETLPSFIITRYKPCVFCYITHDLIHAHSDCVIKIRKAWNQQNTGIRLKFPILQPNNNWLLKRMKSSRAIFRQNGKGFFFDLKEFQPTINRELQTILYLRQALFEYDFLSTGNFFDIPVAVIFFSLNNEDQPELSFPVWCRRKISSSSGIAAIYDENTLEQTIKTFIERSVSSKVEQNYEFAKEEYSIKQDFFRKKMLADHEILMGNYYAAYDLLKQLKNSNEQGITEMMPSILLTFISMSIATGEISQEAISECERLIDMARSWELRLLAILIHYWLMTRSGFQITPKWLIQYLNEESTIKSIVEPFLLEQIAVFHGRNYAYEMMNISEIHKRNDMLEHAVRCLWWAYSALYDSNCYSIHCHLLQSIAQILFRAEYDMKNYAKAFARLLQTDTLELAPMTATYLALMDADQKFKCNFIKVCVKHITSENPYSGPIGFKGDWYQTAQRLFGFAFTNDFFSRNSLKRNEFCIGDELEFRLIIHNNCKEFQAGLASLLIEGPAESTSQMVDFDADITLTLTIKGEGEIKVKGVQFLWCEKIIIYSEFDNPINLYVPEGCPVVTLDLPHNISEAFAGEISVLHTSVTFEKPVYNVSIISSKHYTLVTPKANEIGGQYQLGDFQPSTLDLDFVFASPTKGIKNEYVLIAYMSENNTLGFKHIISTINIKEKESHELSQFPCFTNITEDTISKVPFDLSLYIDENDSTKLIARIESLIKKITNVSIAFDGFVNGKTKNCVDELLKGIPYSTAVEFLSLNGLVITIECNGKKYSTNITEYSKFL